MRRTSAAALGFWSGGRGEGEKAVRARIEAKYADALAKANLNGRILIKARIESEIKAELKRCFPPHALY